MAEYKCGDCVLADVCSELETLVGFSRDNPAYCGMFIKSADAVPVVRCKDCKWWVKWNDIGYCDNPDGLDSYAHPEDFCSYGAQKEGDGNGNA